MPEDWEKEHATVLDEAFILYKKKSQVRGQMWLDFPPSDKIRELRERVMRIENAYKERDQLLDVPTQDLETEARASAVFGELNAVICEDAIDIINYATFLVKQIRRGQRG